MYNCTNIEKVIFNGEKPEFMEFGPYIYTEYDDYNGIYYDETFNPASGTEEMAAFATYSQSTVFKKDGDGHIDEEMYLLN